MKNIFPSEEQNILFNAPSFNWMTAAGLWWAWTWRTLLTSIGLGDVLGLLVGLINHYMIVSTQNMARITAIFGFAIGIGASIWIFRHVLNKKYKRFRIVLLPVSQTSQEKENSNGP